MTPSSLKSLARNIARHGVAVTRDLFGAPRLYGIRGGYTHRTQVSYFDDTPFADEYQKEVYERAAAIAQAEAVRTVYDIGCGSGYKLVHYLGQYDTTGFDLPQTLEYLERQYPDHRWAHTEFSNRSLPPADLVVCSDVIEHVLDPDELMTFLVGATRRWLVLSTPDRNREYPFLSPYRLGPPGTEHHVREWSFREFANYVSRFVDIREHVHSHPTHATQMIVATIRK